MRKLRIAKRVGAALLGLLVVGFMAAAGPATVMSSVSAQSTSSGPTTWHVLVGGQLQNQALQAPVVQVVPEGEQEQNGKRREPRVRGDQRAVARRRDGEIGDQ